MTNLTASVIVVSRGRPEALERCIYGLEQLFYQGFELVVVSDPDGANRVRSMGLDGVVKLVPFDEPNISVARNLGIAQAAGDVVAFIDDDSVPEPTWLDNLIKPFANSGVSAAGGYVRGRNGISFQSRGVWVGTTGAETVETGSGVFKTSPGRAIKTVGTNCAFRRDTLAAIGGFDPVFQFYLDETDLNMRLATNSAKVAIVPDAQVHHGFLASAYRHKSRMPTSLYQVGASLVAYLRKHHDGTFAPILEREKISQRKRLVRNLIIGNCEPCDVERLMTTLDHGFAAGHFREIVPLPVISTPQTSFLPFKPRIAFSGSHVLAGRWRDFGLFSKARDSAKAGNRVSLFQFSATSAFHHVEFIDGVWVQSGGIFGKSHRTDRLLSLYSHNTRLKREIGRINVERGLADHELKK